jgi:hypothetical protein
VVSLVHELSVGPRIGDRNLVRIATTRVRLVQIVRRDRDGRRQSASPSSSSPSLAARPSSAYTTNGSVATGPSAGARVGGCRSGFCPPPRRTCAATAAAHRTSLKLTISWDVRKRRGACELDSCRACRTCSLAVRRSTSVRTFACTRRMVSYDREHTAVRVVPCCIA